MNDRTRPPTRPDADLVADARAGRAEALDELVRRHHAVGFHVALAILGDADDAADALQDALVKAVRALPSFRGDAAFRTWLLSIVANEARGRLRSAARRRETQLDAVAEPVDGATAVDDAVVFGDESARARALLAGLPEKQRLSVELRIDAGLSFREVAEATGSTEGAARVNYHHAIRKLREMMQT